MPEKNKPKSGRKKIKKGNNFVFWFFRTLLTPVLRLRYKFSFDKKTSKGIKSPCFILANHSLLLDSIMIGCGFNFAINFVASDHILRKGFASKLLSFLVHPIPITKSSFDMTAIKNIMSVINQGGAVSLFADACMTYSGVSLGIKGGVAKLAKSMKVPLVLVKVKGGFMTKGRWQTSISRGKMTAAVERVVTPEEMAQMTNDELHEIISANLLDDFYEDQAAAPAKFKGKKRAMYAESVYFICPHCGEKHTLKSSGNHINCSACGLDIFVDEYGYLKSHSGHELPFDTFKAWEQLQYAFMKNYDLDAQTDDQPIFVDQNFKLLKNNYAMDEELVSEGEIKLYKDRLEVGGTVFNIEEIDNIAHIGVYRMHMYLKNGDAYSITNALNQNSYKYIGLFHKIKSFLRGENCDDLGF